jgi:hypothetical protein
MTHNSSCETSKESKCVCACGGRYHGIHSQMSLDDYSSTSKQIRENYGQESIQAQVLNAFEDSEYNRGIEESSKHFEKEFARLYREKGD